MDEFEIELKQGFIEECIQLLDDSEDAFLKLETNREDQSIIEEIFRLAHNLKGSSRAVGFGDVAEFTHSMENLILKIKNSEISVDDEVVSMLLKCNDHIKDMIGTLTNDLEARIDSAEIISEIESLIENGPLKNELHDEAETSEEEEVTFEDVATYNEAVSETSEFSSNPVFEVKVEDPINDQIVSTEENSSHQDEGSNQSIEISEAQAISAPELKVVPKEALVSDDNSSKKSTAKAATIEESIRVSLNRLEKLNNLVGELVILQSVLGQKGRETGSVDLVKNLNQLEKLSKEIHNMSMSLRMTPIRSTIKKMQRIVRDTCKQLDKKVDLVLTGEETEVDKTVIENLNDPLVHIVRNAIDHGMEMSADRLQNGKTEAGRVEINCFHEGNNLVIEISDDGKGIDPNVIEKKALEKGVINPSDNLSKKDIINLIFHPGFSTKEQVSEISGRGVGMDVVKTNIQKMSGQISVDSEVGKGSIFRIVLPLTLAIIEGMVIKVGKENFVVPLLQVHETIHPTKESIEFVTGLGTVLNLRGENLPLLDMREVLRIPPQKEKEAQKNSIAIISRPSGQPFAILVDDIHKQQQIVVKKLGDEIEGGNTSAFMGSSILGNGRPALILDLYEISKYQKASSKVIKLEV